ncbi:MAG: stage 0 sporulation protein [Firmicutes bacterium]|nr:stage 0 sporulation protein [Bacillota bacterium]
MVQVVGVRFKKAGKIYYFDPNDLELEPHCRVIVETARGLEHGEVVVGPKAVAREDLVQPLKSILRQADTEDEIRITENAQKESRALDTCLQKIQKHGLPMKLVDVEYTFDGGKIVFFFTAEGRVDFRELVKDLAATFRTRIELRQIGVRDEARMIGGLGPCGRPLCCATFLGDFEPVSIRMAKDQNLSLNPTKISGLCGRLMCCLKYESDGYRAARAAGQATATAPEEANGKAEEEIAAGGASYVASDNSQPAAGDQGEALAAAPGCPVRNGGLKNCHEAGSACCRAGLVSQLPDGPQVPEKDGKASEAGSSQPGVHSRHPRLPGASARRGGSSLRTRRPVAQNPPSVAAGHPQGSDSKAPRATWGSGGALRQPREQGTATGAGLPASSQDDREVRERQGRRRRRYRMRRPKDGDGQTGARSGDTGLPGDGREGRSALPQDKPSHDSKPDGRERRGN